MDVINFLNRIDEILFKKVPYKFYLVGVFIMMFIVGNCVYEYVNQPKPNNFTIDLSDYKYSGESKIIEERVYQGPVIPTDDESYFRQTGITKPLEVKK